MSAMGDNACKRCYKIILIRFVFFVVVLYIVAHIGKGAFHQIDLTPLQNLFYLFKGLCMQCFTLLSKESCILLILYYITPMARLPLCTYHTNYV